MVGDEITFGGTPLCKTYNLIIAHFEEDPPDPKTEIVEIPFGQDIDITETFGSVNFSNRTQTIEFLALCGGSEFRSLMNEIFSLVHGVRSTYHLSIDPEYTYQGRWTITDQDFSDRKFGKFTIQIDCDPWKIRPDMVYTFNAAPSVTKQFESGRRDVRPSVTTKQDVYVTFKGTREKFETGTHSSSNLVFTWGTNEATFETPEWYFYQTGETLVVNDAYISYDRATQSIVLADEIIELFSSSKRTLTLDDDISTVTVRYEWRDV